MLWLREVGMDNQNGILARPRAYRCAEYDALRFAVNRKVHSRLT
jgi:hypothetical protein